MKSYILWYFYVQIILVYKMQSNVIAQSKIKIKYSRSI